MFRLKVLSTAEKDLGRMDREIARLVIKRLRWLAENYGSITPIPLKGEFKEMHKFRVGDYRVLYSVNLDKQIVIVHYVRHRREAYKDK